MWTLGEDGERVQGALVPGAWWEKKKNPDKAGSQVIGQHKAAVLDHEEDPGDSGEQGKFP